MWENQSIYLRQKQELIHTQRRSVGLGVLLHEDCAKEVI